MYERVGEQLRYSRSRLGFPSCSWLHTAKELRPWLRQWRWAWVTGGSSSEHERRRMEPGSAGSWGEDRASTAMAELGGGLSASVGEDRCVRLWWSRRVALAIVPSPLRSSGVGRRRDRRKLLGDACYSSSINGR
nr:hypothetical protein Iba_scaffold29557CG0010 [Ipomoea batatas]GMD03713.1 hypothetical protein Iba_chr06aCG11510 [Ipomoea batatas]GME01803.1 hypothetical protein Iba_contig2902CG0010 [Ipomoea batatas]